MQKGRDTASLRLYFQFFIKNKIIFSILTRLYRDMVTGKKFKRDREIGQEKFIENIFNLRGSMLLSSYYKIKTSFT